MNKRKMSIYKVTFEWICAHSRSDVGSLFYGPSVCLPPPSHFSTHASIIIFPHSPTRTVSAVTQDGQGIALARVQALQADLVLSLPPIITPPTRLFSPYLFSLLDQSLPAVHSRQLDLGLLSTLEGKWG